MMKIFRYKIEMYKLVSWKRRVVIGKRWDIDAGITAECKEIKEPHEDSFRYVEIEVVAPDNVGRSELKELVKNNFGRELPCTELELLSVDEGD